MTTSVLRKEIHRIIDNMPDRSLPALKPLLDFIAEDYWKPIIEPAAKRPYTCDPDCPLLTEKQLSEFRPVNFATMEERAKAMQKQETSVRLKCSCGCSAW